VKVGDLVRVEDVPRGHGLDSLIGRAGVIMPTPTMPNSWDAYIKVFVENRIQVMLRDHLQLIQVAL
jgi:hypothetical protein